MAHPKQIKRLRTTSGLVQLDTPLRVPSQQTLDKYGLSYLKWVQLAERCGGLCEICGKIPGSGRLVIDHEHAPKWKRMPPAQRVQYVRGLLCSTCNHYLLSRFATVAKLRSAADFLERYENRKHD